MVTIDRSLRENSAMLLGRGGAAICLAGALGRRSRHPAARGLAGLFVLDLAINAPMARRILNQARQSARERDEEQRRLDKAQLAERYSEYHPVLSHVRTVLVELLGSDLPDGAWKSSANRATARLEQIGAALRETRAVRDALVDTDGRLPLIGGHASRVESRREEPMSFKGLLEELRRRLPWRGRRLLHQVRLILEELRLLHNSEIEAAVLRFTLVSRAILVCCTPLLGGWTFARVPFHGASGAADGVWAGSAVVALLTAVKSETVVSRAMTDSADARRFRWRLLGAELPLSLAGLVLCPAWPVAVFASGWTNWWQRQTEHLRFDWTKLAVFVATVVLLQQAGLAVESIPQPAASGETATTLLAILVLGASYGAMLPLTIATAIDVCVGDASRQLLAASRARDELLACARELQTTADTLQGLVRFTPAASRASATAGQAARALETAADRAGRRVSRPSQVVGELVNEAFVRSFLPRRDTPSYEEAARRAVARGEPPPAHIGGRAFDPRNLRQARIRRPRDAARVRAAIEGALNEAAVHGTGGVRILTSLEADRFKVIIANQGKHDNQQRAGLAGEGTRDLRRLAKRLPDGELDEEPGYGSAAEAGLPGETRWWLVRLSCAAAILEEHGQWATG